MKIYEQGNQQKVEKIPVKNSKQIRAARKLSIIRRDDHGY